MAQISHIILDGSDNPDKVDETNRDDSTESAYKIADRLRSEQDNIISLHIAALREALLLPEHKDKLLMGNETTYIISADLGYFLAKSLFNWAKKERFICRMYEDDNGNQVLCLKLR